MDSDNMQNRARKYAHPCDKIVKEINIIHDYCMLSYDFAKLNILEINEEKKIFLQSLRKFCTCVEFSVFNSFNAKTNSLQFLEFLFIKEAF